MLIFFQSSSVWDNCIPLDTWGISKNYTGIISKESIFKYSTFIYTFSWSWTACVYALNNPISHIPFHYHPSPTLWKNHPITYCLEVWKPLEDKIKGTTQNNGLVKASINWGSIIHFGSISLENAFPTKVYFFV